MIDDMMHMKPGNKLEIKTNLNDFPMYDFKVFVFYDLTLVLTFD